MALLPIAIVILLLIGATLAASETAIFALLRMEHTRTRLPAPVQEALERLMRRPLESLIVIIGLNESANVFAECLATIFLIELLGPLGAWLSAPIMLVLVLFFCDITPKTFALGFPGGVARVTARMLAPLAEMVHPAARLFAPSAYMAAPESISESEFKALLRLGERQGEVEPGERALIHKVFDFGNRRVQEVMTPRERMFALDIATPPERLIAEVIQSHFSRVPIFRAGADNIVGVLHAKDLAARRLEASPPRLERLIRKPYFVPPTKPLGELFDEMRHGRFQMALVVDEYGRVLGVATLEDLLEELFGELRDEFDIEGPEITRVGEGEWLVSGGVRVSRLADELGRDASASGFGADGHTLSSFVLRRLGRVPRTGERFAIGAYQAAVERVRGATIELVRLRR